MSFINLSIFFLFNSYTFYFNSIHELLKKFIKYAQFRKKGKIKFLLDSYEHLST